MNAATRKAIECLERLQELDIEFAKMEERHRRTEEALKA